MDTYTSISSGHAAALASANTRTTTWWAGATAVILGSLAALVVNTLPVFLAVLARVRGLSESDSGLVAFAEMGGIAVGTIVCALRPGWVERAGWRWTALLGLLIMLGGNVCSMLAGDLSSLLMARGLAGLGSGVVLAVTYAVLAEGGGARALAIFNFVQLSCGWLGIPFLSPVAEAHGAERLFAIVAGLVVVGMALSFFLPGRRPVVPGHEVSVPHDKVSAPGWLAILSALVYFAGVGAIYAYVAFMGVAWGGTQQVVEAQVANMMFAGLSGGLLVALVGSRFGFRLPLILGYALLLAAMAWLAFGQPVSGFLLAVCLFGFAWNIITPYQFEAVTHVDSSSSAAMLVNASTLGGLAIGPAVAGYLVTEDFFQVNALSLAGTLASLIVLVLALRLSASRQAA